MIELSVLIATVPERKEMFDLLVAEFYRQIEADNLHELVSIEFNDSPRGAMSIGKKRQLMAENARGKNIVYFDDDDFPEQDYLKTIVNALVKHSPDCIGLIIHMTTNGQNDQLCCHSLKYPEWENDVDGWSYVRNVTHFNPVKKELALKAGFKDMRYGEDKDYADRLTALCSFEVFIEDKIMFHYRFSTAEPHAQKYGIE